MHLGQAEPEPRAHDRRGDHAGGEGTRDRPVDVPERPVGDQCGDGERDDGDHRRARRLRRGEPEHQHEDRHEQEPAAVREQPGEESRSRDEPDHQRRTPALGRAGGGLSGVRADQAMRTPTAKSIRPESATSAVPLTKPESAAPASTAGRPASTASLATRRSSSPTLRYSRAPTTAAGSMAGSGDAIAIGAGTPSKHEQRGRERGTTGAEHDRRSCPPRLPRPPPTTTPWIHGAPVCSQRSKT